MDLIVTDLDGTLLDVNHMCSDNTAKKLKELKEREGFILALNTGRFLETIKHVTSNITDLIDYTVAQNGTIIYNKQGEIVFDKKINNALLKYVFDNHVEKLTELMVCDENGATCFLNDKEHLERVAKRGIYFDSSTVEDFKTDFNKLMMIGTAENLKIISDDITKRFDLDAYTPGSEFMEFSAKGFDKGNAVKILDDLVKPDNVLAFGDADNDLGMLSIKGYHTVCMKNGNDNLKVVATAVTKYDNTEEGVVRYLENHYNE